MEKRGMFNGKSQPVDPDGVRGSIAPTLHDFVFLLPDEFLSWMLSLVSGLFSGILLTLMILGDVDASSRRTATNWVGLSAGILIGLALGALRIKEASGPGDYLFAAALTALDVGTVVALEGLASSRRAACRAYAERKAVADRANARVEMAKVHLQRCKDRVRELNGAITTHIAFVGERQLRALNTAEVEATARRAVRDGYFAGIAINRGRVFGAGGKAYE